VEVDGIVQPAAGPAIFANTGRKAVSSERRAAIPPMKSCLVGLLAQQRSKVLRTSK